MTVVGARPQFIKASIVSKILREYAEEILVHTGQHYDQNMSDVFFDELGIPTPEYNLGISSGSHASMTAKMLEAIEKVILIEKPDRMLLYGDTNSTLAAALAAVKLKVPIYHVEAGNRFGTLNNPEEVNRIITDHISTCLMPCTLSAKEFLDIEGLGDRSIIVGDPMYDAFLLYGQKNLKNDIKAFSKGKAIEIPNEYYYMTCHRQENTEDERNIKEILKTMNSLDAVTIFPVHPRVRKTVEKICENEKLSNIILTEPVGYNTSIWLVKNAKKIVTDSGGVQREAFFAEKQCVTVLDFVVWPETMVGNRNQLAKPKMEDIMNKLSKKQIIEKKYLPFGNGHAGNKIVDLLLK